MLPLFYGPELINLLNRSTRLTSIRALRIFTFHRIFVDTGESICRQVHWLSNSIIRLNAIMERRYVTGSIVAGNFCQHFWFRWFRQMAILWASSTERNERNCRAGRSCAEQINSRRENRRHNSVTEQTSDLVRFLTARLHAPRRLLLHLSLHGSSLKWKCRQPNDREHSSRSRKVSSHFSSLLFMQHRVIRVRFYR